MPTTDPFQSAGDPFTQALSDFNGMSANDTAVSSPVIDQSAIDAQNANPSTTVAPTSVDTKGSYVDASGNKIDKRLNPYLVWTSTGDVTVDPKATANPEYNQLVLNMAQEQGKIDPNYNVDVLGGVKNVGLDLLNRTGGLVTGALEGGALGSLVPGVGTVAGAVVGGALGAFAPNVIQAPNRGLVAFGSAATSDLFHSITSDSGASSVNPYQEGLKGVMDSLQGTQTAITPSQALTSSDGKLFGLFDINGQLDPSTGFNWAKLATGATDILGNVLFDPTSWLPGKAEAEAGSVLTGSLAKDAETGIVKPATAATTMDIASGKALTPAYGLQDLTPAGREFHTNALESPEADLFAKTQVQAYEKFQFAKNRSYIPSDSELQSVADNAKQMFANSSLTDELVRQMAESGDGLSKPKDLFDTTLIQRPSIGVGMHIPFIPEHLTVKTLVPYAAPTSKLGTRIDNFVFDVTKRFRPGLEGATSASKDSEVYRLLAANKYQRNFQRAANAQTIKAVASPTLAANMEKDPLFGNKVIHNVETTIGAKAHSLEDYQGLAQNGTVGPMVSEAQPMVDSSEYIASASHPLKSQSFLDSLDKDPVRNPAVTQNFEDTARNIIDQMPDSDLKTLLLKEDDPVAALKKLTMDNAYDVHDSDKMRGVYQNYLKKAGIEQNRDVRDTQKGIDEQYAKSKTDILRKQKQAAELQVRKLEQQWNQTNKKINSAQTSALKKGIVNARKDLKMVTEEYVSAVKNTTPEAVSNLKAQLKTYFGSRVDTAHLSALVDHIQAYSKALGADTGDVLEGSPGASRALVKYANARDDLGTAKELFQDFNKNLGSYSLDDQKAINEMAVNYTRNVTDKLQETHDLTVGGAHLKAMEDLEPFVDQNAAARARVMTNETAFQMLANKSEELRGAIERDGLQKYVNDFGMPTQEILDHAQMFMDNRQRLIDSRRIAGSPVKQQDLYTNGVWGYVPHDNVTKEAPLSINERRVIAGTIKDINEAKVTSHGEFVQFSTNFKKLTLKMGFDADKWDAHVAWYTAIAPEGVPVNDFNEDQLTNYSDKVIKNLPVLDKVAFTQTMADAITGYKQASISFKEPALFLKGLDAFTKFWRLYTSKVFVTYLARNTVGNVLQSLVTVGLDTLNPKNYMEAFRLGMGEDFDIIRKDGSVINSSILHDSYGSISMINKGKVLNDGQEALFGGSKETDAIGHAVASAAGVLTVGAFTPKVARMLNEASDQITRSALFMSEIRNGKTAAEAVDTVQHVLFDYSNMSAFEKNVMSRLVIGYSWNMKNLVLQAENVIRNPMMFTVTRAAIQAYGAKIDASQFEASLPGALRGIFALDIGLHSPITGQPLLITSFGSPFESALSQTKAIFDILDGKPDLVNQLNPVIKTAMNMWFNKDTASGNAIWGNDVKTSKFDSYMVGLKSTAPPLYEALVSLLHYNRQLVTLKNGTQYYSSTVDPTSLFFLNNIPISRYITQGNILLASSFLHDASVLSNQDNSTASLVANYLGIKMTNFDPVSAQSTLTKAVNDQLAAMYQNTGLGYTSTSIVLPRATKEALGLPVGALPSTVGSSTDPFAQFNTPAQYVKAFKNLMTKEFPNTQTTLAANLKKQFGGAAKVSIGSGSSSGSSSSGSGKAQFDAYGNSFAKSGKISSQAMSDIKQEEKSANKQILAAKRFGKKPRYKRMKFHQKIGFADKAAPKIKPKYAHKKPPVIFKY